MAAQKDIAADFVSARFFLVAATQRFIPKTHPVGCLVEHGAVFNQHFKLETQ